MNIPIHQIRWRVVVDGKEHVITQKQGARITTRRGWTDLCKGLRRQAKRGGVASVTMLLEVVLADDVKRRYRLPLASYPDGTMPSPPWCPHQHAAGCDCDDDARAEAVAKNPEEVNAAGEVLAKTIFALMQGYREAYNRDFAAAENGGAANRMLLDIMVDGGFVPVLAL